MAKQDAKDILSIKGEVREVIGGENVKRKISPEQNGEYIFVITWAWKI